MKRFKTKSLIGIIMIISFIFMTGASLMAAEVKTMSKEDLKKIIDTDTVTILDVRSGRDWSSSEFKIKNAKYIDPKKFSADAIYASKENTVVLYCA